MKLKSSMVNNNTFIKVFRNGSKTYFYSSLFFPKEIRNDVFILYSFVRTADNFVDEIPQQKKEFLQFRSTYSDALKGKYTDNEIIYAFVDLLKRKKIDPQWVEAFLDAMQQDLSKKTYKTIGETEQYMYGSAEVIGLFMAKIMDLPRESHSAARKLGKAMQLINFIRDIEEDNSLGRTYLPLDEIKQAGLKGIHKNDALTNPNAFESFINKQLNRYQQWQEEAVKGFHFIPYRYLIPIKTASDMYQYTASKIMNNPLVVFEKKIKPTRYQILFTGIKNSLFIYG